MDQEKMIKSIICSNLDWTEKWTIIFRMGFFDEITSSDKFSWIAKKVKTVKKHNSLNVFDIYQITKDIFRCNMSWEDKYDLIFSKQISGRFDIEWCDLDTSEQEDVTRWMMAFDSYICEILK